MTIPVRLCEVDGFELVLDLETARAAVDAGWPAVEMWVCRMGHSHRVWPEETPKRRWHGTRPCAVCGGPLPPLKDRHSLGTRRYHAGPCTVFASRERTTWTNRHPGEPFVLERQSWYRGPLATMVPLPPLDPLAGRLPRVWLEGWCHAYGIKSA